MSSIEERLSKLGSVLSEPRRSFDVGAGLRRLARDTGYLPPFPSAPPADGSARGDNVPQGPRAGHQLTAIARWVLNTPQATNHLGRLAREIGANGPAGPLAHDLDVEGSLVFACMLYLAGHQESAAFWWQFAAGADTRVAAYCLHLHHLQLGALKEADYWLAQFRQGDDEDGDDILALVEHFTGYLRRRSPVTPAIRSGLTQEVVRLANRKDDGSVLVFPERELAERLQSCADRH
ncbi:hypothetical protein [Streptomyces sp. NPDC005435]|uniref:hypothetical protein n=1 Tax=Streptomyces sp. NPDC005435 TaxID=3154464 RepID=UPI0034545BF5